MNTSTAQAISYLMGYMENQIPVRLGNHKEHWAIIKMNTQSDMPYDYIQLERIDDNRPPKRLSMNGEMADIIQLIVPTPHE